MFATRTIENIIRTGGSYFLRELYRNWSVLHAETYSYRSNAHVCVCVYYVLICPSGIYSVR